MAKLDSAGNHLWSKRFGDASLQSASAIAVAPAGDVVITGGNSGTTDFGGGALSAGAFIAKFNSAGSHVWSKTYPATTAKDVLIDASGNIEAVGSYSGAPNFGNGALPAPGAGEAGIYVAKLGGGTGAGIWSKGLLSAGSNAANAVAVDGSGNVIVAGSYGGTLVPSPCGTFAASGTDAFLMKLDMNGACAWFKRFGDASIQFGLGVGVDALGNVFLGGQFQGAIDLGGGSLASLGNSDVFLAKLTTAGTHVWSKRFGSATVDQFSALAVGTAGDVWVAGTFDATIDFGGGTIATGGSTDMFVGRLNSGGNHVWSKGFGGTGTQLLFGVALDSAQDLLVAGTHTTGTVDFGTGPLTSAGGPGWQDAVLAKIGQ